ncbi:hypothetical protein BD410DRAFT_140609 [Rickenella mellea]|uniref:Secreted protein n=1 Tax=Rickenella mellea TaxID=50990 RepID=A0A4Y7PHR4_9AGAM|nr:hypothetical protein BD410DRAFT_140609 [Rickenella mellea]
MQARNDFLASFMVFLIPLHTECHLLSKVVTNGRTRRDMRCLEHLRCERRDDLRHSGSEQSCEFTPLSGRVDVEIFANHVR